MKNSLLILITLLTISCKSPQNETAEKINVLFIGNSLTYFHDMPQTVQKMLNETDPNIKVEQSTFPGQSLPGHLSDIITSRTESGITTRKKEKGEKPPFISFVFVNLEVPEKLYPLCRFARCEIRAKKRFFFIENGCDF